MKIFITRISGDPGDLKPRVPPDQIPSVSSSNGRPTCSQNSRAFKRLFTNTAGIRIQPWRYFPKPRVALSCTSFVNDNETHLYEIWYHLIMDSINKLLGDHCVFTLKPFHPPMQVVQQYIASHEAPLQYTALYYTTNTLLFTPFDYITTGQCIAALRHTTSH